MMKEKWKWDGHVVWVSGATGSWGSELCRQLLQFPIEKLICYCRGDHRGAALEQQLDDPRVRIHVGDIRDPRTVQRSIDETVSAVIHCAALKRVDTGSYSPFEMDSTNINGTQEVIEACLQRRRDCLQVAYYLSSDKAALPTTFYGATKYAAEQLWIGANVYSPAPHPPVFCTARWGNALNSTGSVLQVWEKQVSKGIHPTIYDPEATRFVVTIPEAVAEILHIQIPLAWQTDQRLFLPEMPAVTIATLADAYAGEQCPKTVLGYSRGMGEKKHEVLCANPEPWQSSETARRLSVEEMRKILRQIQQCLVSEGVKK